MHTPLPPQRIILVKYTVNIKHHQVKFLAMDIINQKLREGQKDDLLNQWKNMNIKYLERNT